MHSIKNLLYFSENFHRAKKLTNLGIEVGEVKFNLEKMMKNKEKAVSTLTKGVEFLFKKNKVTHIKGIASFKSKNQIYINLIIGTIDIIQNSSMLIFQQI